MLVGVGAAWVGTVRLPRRGKLIILRGARLEITHHWMGEEMGGGGGAQLENPSSQRMSKRVGLMMQLGGDGEVLYTTKLNAICLEPDASRASSCQIVSFIANSTRLQIYLQLISPTFFFSSKRLSATLLSVPFRVIRMLLHPDISLRQDITGDGFRKHQFV